MMRSAFLGGTLAAVDSVPGAAAAEATQSLPMNFLTGYGDRAFPVVNLTWGVLAISVIVVIVITALLLGALFRRRPGGWAHDPARLPVSREGNGLPWISIGVGISTVVLFGTVVWTMTTLSAVMEPGEDTALTIEVDAHQWWWEVRYLGDSPDEIFTTANEIHIPVGRPVRVRLVGGDVIHSFWVPALSGKTDVIPGRTNRTWIEASEPGVYRGQCAEYCGLQHAKMGLFVIASPEDEFEAWREAQLAPASDDIAEDAARGREDFMRNCSACHTVRGTPAGGAVGPDLTHVASRRTIAAGTLENTPANLTAWIEDAQTFKPGNRMPTLDLEGQTLMDIVAYLETLE